MTDADPERIDFTALQELDVDTDELFDVLSNERRRFVVRCLETHSTPMALADVADELATWEHDAPITEVSAEEVRSIYVSLYHVHVPRMADAGVVTYSQERDSVALETEYEDIVSSLVLPE